MDKLNRLMALDIGDKRIGVALSDPFGLFVSETFLVQRKVDNVALNEIEDLCKKFAVQKILVGVPYNMDGTFGFQAEKNVNFIAPLKDKYELIYRDERLTSFQAEENLKKKNVKYTRNKGLVDIKSACIILEDYLGENDGQI